MPETTGDFDPVLEQGTNFDPFHPDNVGTLQFIMLSRIYDVLMAGLDSRNPEAAAKVLDLHSKGYILGPPPVLNGEFLTENQEPDEQIDA